MLEILKKELKEYSNPKEIDKFKYFHKTGTDGYARDDKFLGVTVGDVREVAKKYYKDVDLNDIQELFNSEYHEERLLACLIVVKKFEKVKKESKKAKEIVDFYIQNYMNINGWDLVDLSAPKILGEYLVMYPTESKLLYDLADSDNIWKQRIAVVSNWSVIKYKNYEHILNIADKLLNTKEDLIQKAIGWMLREVGKMDYSVEYDFLKSRYNKMPRTMLRYSIEKFEENTRQDFLKGRI